MATSYSCPFAPLAYLSSYDLGSPRLPPYIFQIKFRHKAGHPASLVCLPQRRRGCHFRLVAMASVRLAVRLGHSLRLCASAGDHISKLALSASLRLSSLRLLREIIPRNWSFSASLRLCGRSFLEKGCPACCRDIQLCIILSPLGAWSAPHNISPQNRHPRYPGFDQLLCPCF